MSNVEQTMAVYQKTKQKKLSLESFGAIYSNRDWPEVPLPSVAHDNMWQLVYIHKY